MSITHPCSYPGCSALVSGTRGRCDVHKDDWKKRHEKQREQSHKRGYDYEWRKAKTAFLKDHPLCECDTCKSLPPPRRKRATAVDHITPHRGDKVLFWDRRNWKAMSHTCHSRKTAMMDGGFGNSRRVTTSERTEGRRLVIRNGVKTYE